MARTTPGDRQSLATHRHLMLMGRDHLAEHAMMMMMIDSLTATVIDRSEPREAVYVRMSPSAVCPTIYHCGVVKTFISK